MKDIQIIPLTEAIFCTECLCFTNSKGHECVACTSKSLLAMAPVMGRKRELEPIFDKMEQN